MDVVLHSLWSSNKCLSSSSLELKVFLHFSQLKTSASLMCSWACLSNCSSVGNVNPHSLHLYSSFPDKTTEET